MSDYTREEREAWDMYLVALVSADKDATYDACVAVADVLLEERRKRFPPATCQDVRVETGGVGGDGDVPGSSGGIDAFGRLIPPIETAITETQLKSYYDIYQETLCERCKIQVTPAVRCDACALVGSKAVLAVAKAREERPKETSEWVGKTLAQIGYTVQEQWRAKEFDRDPDVWDRESVSYRDTWEVIVKTILAAAKARGDA